MITENILILVTNRGKVIADTIPSATAYGSVITASYATSASWAPGNNTPVVSPTASYAISASWASSSLSALLSITAQKILVTNDTENTEKYVIALGDKTGNLNVETVGEITINPDTKLLTATASWAKNSLLAVNSVSASWAPPSVPASTSSYAMRAAVADALITAPVVVTASYALVSGLANSISFVPATASYALTTGQQAIAILSTGSTYPITASRAISASWAPSLTPPLTASYAISASWAPSANANLTVGAKYPITSSWAETASVYFSASNLSTMQWIPDGATVKGIVGFHSSTSNDFVVAQQSAPAGGLLLSAGNKNKVYITDAGKIQFTGSVSGIDSASYAKTASYAMQVNSVTNISTLTSSNVIINSSGLFIKSNLNDWWRLSVYNSGTGSTVTTQLDGPYNL